jgi:hypothetical protein
MAFSGAATLGRDIGDLGIRTAAPSIRDESCLCYPFSGIRLTSGRIRRMAAASRSGGRREVRMRLSTRILAGVILSAVLLTPVVLKASTKSGELKLSLKAPRSKTLVGETAVLQLKLKNRTDTTREVAVELIYKDATEPYAVETVTLGPKEKVKLDVDCPVPADFLGKKLRVYARAEGLEDRAKVKVKLGDITDEQWIEGRDLYQAECARCHGKKGGEVRGDSLDRWISAMQKGPGSMPRYPSIGVAEIILMREYVKDADREVSE